jgi:plasmid stabilization system protein ParE
VSGRRLRFNPLAEAEILEAARWYEDRSPGLGAAFVDAVRDATATVLEAPKRWRLVRGTRRYLMGEIPLCCRLPRDLGKRSRGRGGGALEATATVLVEAVEDWTALQEFRSSEDRDLARRPYRLESLPRPRSSGG